MGVVVPPPFSDDGKDDKWTKGRQQQGVGSDLVDRIEQEESLGGAKNASRSSSRSHSSRVGTVRAATAAAAAANNKKDKEKMMTTTKSKKQTTTTTTRRRISGGGDDDNYDDGNTRDGSSNSLSSSSSGTGKTGTTTTTTNTNGLSLAAKETRQVHVSKFVMLLVLGVAASAVGYFTYRFTSQAEETEFVSSVSFRFYMYTMMVCFRLHFCLVYVGCVFLHSCLISMVCFVMS